MQPDEKRCASICERPPKNLPATVRPDIPPTPRKYARICLTAASTCVTHALRCLPITNRKSTATIIKLRKYAKACATAAPITPYLVMNP